MAVQPEPLGGGAEEERLAVGGRVMSGWTSGWVGGCGWVSGCEWEGAWYTVLGPVPMPAGRSFVAWRMQDSHRPAPQRAQVLCARYTDEEYRARRCPPDEWARRWGAWGVERVWRDDVLPCRWAQRCNFIMCLKLGPVSLTYQPDISVLFGACGATMCFPCRWALS